ncbi:MAG TPA: hypothetical protein VHW23_25140 [Kofleriaceae bacterium]|nr:hypothetical protein [Kofleriaceae bacterium]
MKVAVVPGIVVNLDAARVDVLTQELAEALQAELEVEAIGGVEVRRRLPPAGLPTDCVASEACLSDVARRLDAQELLFVVLIDTGSSGAIQIDSTWVDPVAHRSVSRPAIDIASIADARVRFAAVAAQMLPDAPVRPKPSASLGRMSEPVPRHFTLPSYLTAGAAVIGLGTGISLGLNTRTRYDDCTAQAHDGTACSQSRKDSIRRLALVADAGWLVAIGATIATAILYATSSEGSHVIVEPVPGGAALTASGRF